MPDFLQRHDLCGLVAAGCAAGCAASSAAASAPCARPAQRGRQPASGRRRDPTPVCSTPASHAKQSSRSLVHLCPPAGPCHGLQCRLAGLLLCAGAVSGAARLRPGRRVARTQRRLAARHSCKVSTEATLQGTVGACTPRPLASAARITTPGSTPLRAPAAPGRPPGCARGAPGPAASRAGAGRRPPASPIPPAPGRACVNTRSASKRPGEAQGCCSCGSRDASGWRSLGCAWPTSPTSPMPERTGQAVAGTCELLESYQGVKDGLCSLAPG